VKRYPSAKVRWSGKVLRGLEMLESVEATANIPWDARGLADIAAARAWISNQRAEQDQRAAARAKAGHPAPRGWDRT
jgi:hypothetical protein